MRIGSKENDLDRAQFLCRARFRVVRRLGSNDSCGTNNSRIVLGISLASLQCEKFFHFTEILDFAAAQAVSPSLRRTSPRKSTNCLIGPPTKDATNQPTLPTKTRRSCPIALRIAPSTPSSPLTLSTNPQRRTARSTYPLCRAEDAHDTFVRSTRARRSRHVRFAPKADKEQTRRYVRFVPPLASLTRCSKLAPVSAAILVFGQPLAPPGRRMVVQCGTPPVFSAFVCK
jgi:hypothetical protein